MYTSHYLGIGKRKIGKKMKKNKSVIRAKDRKLSNKDEGDKDRLSELPDSLILYILSLIKGGIKEVIKRTCLLSKRWQFIWTHMSEIELYEYSDNRNGITWKNNNELYEYLNFVGRVLHMCSVNNLHRFSVRFTYDERFTTNINSWVQIAVERNVKDISLTLSNVNDQSYELPQILYSHSSLTSFAINCCVMTPRETINWRSMKSLTIRYVKLSDCVMANILTSCPLLEALRLDYCKGFTCLNISSPTFTKLEIVVLDTPTIDISAPYTRELKIEWVNNITQVRLRDLTSLVRASLSSFNGSKAQSTQIYTIELLQSLQYVKELELGRYCVKTVSNLDSKGRNIPISTRLCLTLKLSNGVSFPGILWILKSSPYLETLTIEGHEHFSEEYIPKYGVKYLENVDFAFHHLKTINIKGLKGESMKILVRILLKISNVLQKLTVTYNSEYESEKLSKALLGYPRASPEAIVKVNRGFIYRRI